MKRGAKRLPKIRFAKQRGMKAPLSQDSLNHFLTKFSVAKTKA